MAFGLCANAALKPNIVFILADDMGSYDVGWRGSKIKTPNLDRLCAQGAKLENFYVQPVCSPTRSSLMTGRYPMRYGMQVGVIRPWAKYGLSLEERTLPQALREAGYSTAMCGKWHLGSFEKAYWPNARGFDYWYGHLMGALDYFTHIRDGKLDWYRNGELNHDEGYSTFLVGEDAAKVIRNQPKDKPLFLYVPFNAVHDPLEVPAEYSKQYSAMGGSRKTYAGMVTALDDMVGKIVAAVDESGQRQNTLFIFASDNGGPAPHRITSNGPLRGGKFTLYEGGVHTCAFATWDGKIKPGSSVNALMHMVDWYPTLLKLGGASLTQKLPLDGTDMWPSITEGKPSPRTEVLCNASPSTGGIRVGDWKLVINGDKRDTDEEAPVTRGKTKPEHPADKLELFNLADDPSEKTNLAESNPKKVKELLKRYNSYASQAVVPKNEKTAGAPAAVSRKSPVGRLGK
ncbi:MAG: atsA 16 [Verrucomicrobiales bacterium]|nr:atsA 16 [Verrucomicrobiales bacterium]